jgi:hypothetical protein
VCGGANKIIPYKFGYGINLLSEEHNSGVFYTKIIELQNYKPPGVKDIPIDLRVYFRRKAPNPFGVLRSKGTIHIILHTHFCLSYIFINFPFNDQLMIIYL